MSFTRVGVGVALCWVLSIVPVALRPAGPLLWSERDADRAVNAKSPGRETGPPILPDRVVNAGSFLPAIAPSTWIAVFGTNLAPTTREWRESDFSGGSLPTALEGVSVRINGMAAYPSFVSPTQLNVLVPDDTVEGPVSLQVVTPAGVSDPLTISKQRIAPAFFMLDAQAYRYLAAVHPDGTLIGKAGLYPGVSANPASPGGLALLFANGFGATNPAHRASDTVQSPAPLSNPVTVRIGNVPAPVVWAGLVMPGVYQLNVVIPEVPDGDQSVVADIAGGRTQDNAYISVQRQASPSSARPIVIDHTTTDLARIPDYWIERVKQNLKMYFGHTSHGAQITNGLLSLQSQLGPRYSVAIDWSLPSRTATLNIMEASTYDWDPDFYPTVAKILNANPAINVVMYMWCSQPGGVNWQALLKQYIADMQSLEQKYPAVTFVYATGNAQDKDCSGCVRHQFNEQLRRFARQNNKVLFDFGDLDVWYNGVLYTYSAPNWCSTYGCPAGMAIPTEHPQWGGGDYNNPCGHATSASCDNKGRAMWWLMARIAGWDGISSGPPAALRRLPSGGIAGPPPAPLPAFASARRGR